MYSDTFQLSNGTYRGPFFAQPIRWKDASGNWQNFNTNLIGAGAAGLYRATNLPVAVTLGTTGTGSQPAQLSADGYTITWNVQGTTAGVPLAPGASSASYLGVAPDTTLSYQVLNWGVEQSLILSSAAAPASFTCTLSHPGLTLAQDSTDGQWGLYAPGDPYPIFTLSGISVYDSSSDASGNPATCTAATMAVSPGSGQSTLTYSVPQSWLSDAARVYPVTIDPTITLNPAAGDNPYCDTFINSSPGTGSHGTATNLYCGDDSSDGYCRDLVDFSTAAIPAGAYINSATFEIYKFYQGTGSSPTISVGPMIESWDSGSSWNALGAVVNQWTGNWALNWIFQGHVATNSWLSCDATSTVQSWISGQAPNDGFCVRENEANDSTYESKFYSADYSSGAYAPQLVVNYDPSPYTSVTSDSSVYSWGDTAVISTQANSFYQGDVQWIETALNITNSDSTTWRGVLGWFKSAAMIPSTRWVNAGSLADGTVVAYYSDAANPTDYGANLITLNPANCSVSYPLGDSGGGSSDTPGCTKVNFSITIGNSFGYLTGVVPATRFAMGPTTGTPTWSSYGSSAAALAGDLAHPPTCTGWSAQSGSAFSVIKTKITTLTYAAQGSAWFNSASGPDNSNAAGRGAATLMWPKTSGASGYHVYLNDGNGGYRQVGSTIGGGAVSWSSSGDAFYPSDTEIAGLTTGSDPYYRAATPADGASAQTPSTCLATVTPAPTPSPCPSSSPGDGICLTDGTYLYVHRAYQVGGPTTWNKIGTGFNGTTRGQNYGTIGSSLIGTMGYSAFLSNGVLFDSNNSYGGGSSATVSGTRISDGSTQTFTFSGEPPLNFMKGSGLYGSGGYLMLCSATDAQGVNHIYSVAETQTTDSNGNPHYDGYRIREFDASGNFVADHIVGSTSEQMSGVIGDGAFLYIIGWPSTAPVNGARITKISTTTWQVVNQWPINQGTTHVDGGCYDPTHNVFWLGAIDQNRIYEYSGSGGGPGSSPGFDLRDNPNPLYAKTASTGTGPYPAGPAMTSRWCPTPTTQTA